MRVRLATPADLEAVFALHVALWPDAATEEHRGEVEATLAGHPRSTLPLIDFVAEEEQGLVGFVEIGLRSHANGCDGSRPCGFVEGWYVVPEQRRRGVGRALLARAEAWAREQGCTELGSDTWLDHEGSQDAHVALGFEVVDRCVNFRKALSREEK